MARVASNFGVIYYPEHGQTIHSQAVAVLDPQGRLIITAMADRTVTINSLSKSHAMTGWRIGYCGGPQELIEAMENVQSHSTSNPTVCLG